MIRDTAMRRSCAILLSENNFAQPAACCLIGDDAILAKSARISIRQTSYFFVARVCESSRDPGFPIHGYDVRRICQTDMAVIKRASAVGSSLQRQTKMRRSAYKAIANAPRETDSEFPFPDWDGTCVRARWYGRAKRHEGA